ncbi:receptor-like protein EIX2 [Morus notabilis]|uniref:receptor-like protein EIX2 n=1 Tax=Morus notabilis TaxID=981085 RepID=UPI000CECE494|nr:receptor-like protein EIX2 [Morus notabilis]
MVGSKLSASQKKKKKKLLKSFHQNFLICSFAVMGRLIVVFLVLSVCLVCTHGSNTSTSARAGEPKIRCMEAERKALLNIKKDLQGTRKDIDDLLSSWGNEEERRDCCKWLGIRCSNKSGNVISLDLSPSTFGTSYYNLKGKISPSLFELRNLTYLDLSVIGFSRRDHIPSSIGSLSQLRYLNLSSTSFMGEIPPQFANLSSLEVLDLSDNNDLVTTKILESASHLSSLRILVLSSTNLSTASDWMQRVSQLSSLTTLQLHSCHLPNISSNNPSSISFVNSSRSVAFLDLRWNRLSTSIYPWLLNLNSLVHLDLSENRLEGSFPEALGKMVDLTYLDLRYNMLKGSIPESFGKMVGLTYLGLSFNDLSDSIPEIFYNMSALEYLDLGHNLLHGQIPTSIWNRSKLRTLRMGSNNLSGDIPQTAFQQFKQLEILDISRNSLGGVISEAGFSNLSQLTYLDLSFNSLTLDIHPDWVPPFQLDYILLASCKLGPLFPKWLQTQKNYYQLDISNSGISDTIPNWLWDPLSGDIIWDDTSYLNLSNNEIKGEFGNISLEIENYSWQIDLSSNQLEGPVPSFLLNVVALYISRNRFSKLDFRCNDTGFANLGFLDVSYNQLFGELPDCWSQFESLETLILTDNNLSGKIPSSIGSLTALGILQLTDNNFNGELPTTLKNCTNLIVIDVGGNKLSGLIPSWTENSFPQLTILNLRSNNFSGSIPSSICHFSNLQLLDLSSNDITGRIPKCINSLAAMTRRTVDLPGSLIYGTYIKGRDSYNKVKVQIEWKGKLTELVSTLDFLKSIDLSSNRLIGEIPSEITQVVGLVSLNLSRNSLSGQIPSEIGQLASLDSLDLSRNHLVGQIPPSLTHIDRLNALDLSNNNLSGKIPTSTQLQSFPNAYMGNAELCGDPLPTKCQDEELERTDSGAVDEEADDELLTRGFYISMALGFIIAFWGVCGTLIFNKSLRYGYFKLLNDAGDWVYVMAAVHKAKLLRMIKS